MAIAISAFFIGCVVVPPAAFVVLYAMESKGSLAFETLEDVHP